MKMKGRTLIQKDARYGTIRIMKKKPLHKLKPGYVRCPDCGVQYLAGRPHVMFCPAHTCDQCGGSSSQVIEVGVYVAGQRLCERCGTEAA